MESYSSGGSTIYHAGLDGVATRFTDSNGDVAASAEVDTYGRLVDF
ncbi:MAG: hypothetical protein HYV63_04645 [Candidatus Schekmanbacteria bacterium]|nr:hypothetical protein [Candidatus Schekmanbacteria bacterium]